MKVITESFLRDTFRQSVPGTFYVEADQILTPSATQLLNEKGVEIVRGDKSEKVSEPKETALKPTEEKRNRYLSLIDGGAFETKPEHMTQLRGNSLIVKDHPTIVFRGKLDSFQADVLLVVQKAMDLGKNRAVEDLNDLLLWARQIMSADVKQEPLPQRDILGLSDDELRERSHHPKPYIGVGHFLAEGGMGELLLLLNRLRSQIREVEVAAVHAFKHDFKVERPDLIQALNRMSSAIYLMMLMEKVSGEPAGGQTFKKFDK